VPSPPAFSIRNITDSQFSLSWKEPNYLPGYLEKFKIIIEWKHLNANQIPNWCPREEEQNHSKTVNGSVFEYDYLEVKAFMKYEVYMKAKTSEGWSNSSGPEKILSNSGGTFFLLSFISLFHYKIIFN